MVEEDQTGAMCESDGASFAVDYEQFVDVEWSDAEDLQWDEGDGEAELDGPALDFLAFGALIEIDDSSYERWLQSCLKGLVAPDLVVDGVPGGKTRQAIRAFQRQVGRLRPGARALTVDGVDGPATVAALELCTNSTHPPRATGKPATPAVVVPESMPAQPGTQRGVFTLTTTDGAHHTVQAYGDRVSFRYKTRDRTGVDGKTLCDAFNVMAYDGARRDLLRDEMLIARGFSASEIAILRENAFKESRGSFGAVNSWDDQIVSWGMAQFAGHAGSLAGLLIFLKEHAPGAFARFFLAAGIDVEHGPYPYFDRKARCEISRTGAHVKIEADGVVYRGDRGWAYLRTQPVLVGALMLAGNDVEVQVGQCLFWKEMFLDRAVATRIGGRTSHRVVRVHGTGASRSETTLLAGADSEAAWQAWAARPENLIEGKNLARLLGRADRHVHRTREGDRVVVTVEKVPGQPLRSFCSSTYGLGIMARLYNWMPAYVRTWSEEFLKELAASHSGVDVADPAAWDREPALETEFIEKVKARRRQVKKGSYDPPYGDTLNRARGSFTAGAAVELPAAPDGGDEASDEEAAIIAADPERPQAGAIAELVLEAVVVTAGVDEPPAVRSSVSGVVAPGGAGSAVVADTTEPVPEDRPDFDVTAQSPGEKRKRTRAWSELKGITLHQTGVHGFGARAWPRVTAHMGVHSDGRVYLIHPLQAYLWSSDALNRDTVAIEVAGNFIGDPARPASFWKQGGGPSTLTPAMIDGLRRAIRWIVAEVARNGGEITDVFAHRQAKRGKSNCPGAEIWLHAGVWAQTELGLGNGGPGFTRSDGQPIPPAWDPRLLDQPLPFADPDAYVIDFEAMTAEEGAEFPAEGEDPFAARPEVVASAVRIRSLPAGMRLAESGRDETVTRGRLDLSAPIDLDAAEDVAITGQLDEALARQGLVVIDTITLEPDSGARARSLDAIDLDGAADDALEFDITIEEDERAVVLLEQDGMFCWSLPEDGADGPRTRGSGGVARFRIPRGPVDVVADGPTTRGLISGVLGGAIRARVYKFIAGLVMAHGLPALIEHLERGVREGVVLVRGDDLRDWVDREDLGELRLPRDRPARVLLLVHGTFSSTRGSFGGLCTGSGPDALRRMLAGYDAVFGVDHRSLSRAPQDNAAAIRDLLLAHPWPHPPEVDIVCFSRGGLVTRELVERVLPGAGWQGTIGRVICVATTNAGTELARADNWRDLIDVYTTLACATMRGLGLAGGGLAALVGGEVVTAVGALVQALASGLLQDGTVPGLSAMDPEGEVVQALNARTLPAGPGPRYFAITSCFDASKPGAAGLTAHAKRVLAGRVTGKLYRGAASDLVVHNASTHTLHPSRSYSDRHHFEANGSVYHVNFFLQPEVVARLVAWLGLAEVQPARPPGFVIPALVRREAFEDQPLAFGPDDALVDLHVRAEAPARVGLEELFTVHVELSREALALEAGVNAALASALVEASELVTVELVPRARVSPVAQLPVSVAVPAQGGSVGLWFRLRAEEVGEGELWVIVRQRGRPLARLVLRVQVAEGTGVAAELVRAAAAPDRAAGVEPDAVLEVIELREAGGLRYRYHLRAAALGLHHRFESRLIPSGADDYVRGLFDRIEREWKSAGADPRAFDRRLRALGVQLGEQLLPPELMALLWDRREQLLGLQLLSDEGRIPWELVHLKHPERPLAADQSAFLGQLGLVRALWGVALPQRLSARAGKAFTVVPEYPTPALALPSALSERTWLSEHVGARPMDPRPEATLDALATPGSFDLLHFACHGEVEAH
ncbi:MAG TPA: N-acetylmuramoyl-L-alanine amidase, partial [Nannocystis sp.]